MHRNNHWKLMLIKYVLLEFDSCLVYSKIVVNLLTTNWVCFHLNNSIVVTICIHHYFQYLFRGTPYNSTKFAIWEKKGISPAVPGILDLYKKLQSLRYKTVFISGRPESLREESRFRQLGEARTKSTCEAFFYL